VYAKKYPKVVGCGFIFSIAEGQKPRVEEQTLRAFQDLKFHVFFYEIPPESVGTLGQFRDRMEGDNKNLIDEIKKAVGFEN
jgi:hypothetical protein